MFASEEWPDYVSNLYSDGFAFFVDGENIALTPDGLGVSIGSINCMGCAGSHCCSNCDLLNDNGGLSIQSSCSSRDDIYGPWDNQEKFTYNSYTKVLEGSKFLEPGVHTMKMLVADMRDGQYDSSVFIARKSIVAVPVVNKTVVPVVLGNISLCYSLTQACSTAFEEVFVRPLTIYPSGHPILTRTDCGGAPSSDKLPREGEILGGDCVTKVDGSVLFYSYDPTTRSGRDQLAKDGQLLMYVIRDSDERAYLVVSLGKPMLGAGKTKAGIIMSVNLVNVTGNPSPIVKDDPDGDVYDWYPTTNRGRFKWTWGREETDGVVLGPFVEGAGWCVEWDMSEMSPRGSLTSFEFGSYENGRFETKSVLSDDVFDMGGGKGVRLCSCPTKRGDTCEESTCRIADNCVLSQPTSTGSGGTGSGSGGTGTGTSGAGPTGASSGTGGISGRGTAGGQVGGTGGSDCGGSSGGGDCGMGVGGPGGGGGGGSDSDMSGGSATPGTVSGTPSYGELDAGSITVLVLFGLSCTCCLVAALVVPYKKRSADSKRKTMASKSKARRSMDVPAGDRDGIEMVTVGFGGRSREDTVARRKMLSEALKGSRWWYIDLDGFEQGPFGSEGEL